MLEEYLLSRKESIRQQLEYRWMSNTGHDVSGLLRGMIQMIDEFLNIKNVFNQVDEMEKKVKEFEGKVKN